MRKIVLSLALVVALFSYPSRGDSPKSPEDVFKDKGLVRSGYLLLLPIDPSLRDGVAAIRSAKAKLDASAVTLRDWDAQIRAAGRDHQAMEDEAHDILEKIDKGDKSNKLAVRYNLLLENLRKQQQTIDDMEEKRRKLVMSKSDYITAVLDAAKKADEAAHAYDGPTSDKELAAAIDSFNVTAKPRVKLGPSSNFNDDLAFVAKCRSEISTGSIPITVEGGVPNVDVLINGKLTQRMIWDSGCTDIALSAKTAKSLGLTPLDSDPIEEGSIANGQTVRWHVKTLQSIRIGAIVVRDLKCSIPENGSEGADLLGNEFQSNFQFKLDMNAQTLQLTPLFTDEVKKPVPVRPGIRSNVDLLEGLSLEDQTVSGNWKLEDGVLTSDRSQFARLDFNYRPAKEYDFKVTFTKLSGNDSISMMICANGRQFLWVMGGWGNSCCGFDDIGGITGMHNPTTVKGHALQVGKTCNCMVKVRADSVSAYLDGELLSRWQTDYRDMGCYPRVHLHRPDTVGIFTQESSYAISNAEIVEIGTPGKKVAPSDPSNARLIAEAEYNIGDEHRVIKLYDNGHFGSPKDQTYLWYLRGNSLDFRWNDSVDHCTLSADMRTFTGHGSGNNPIQGKIVSGGLAGEPVATASSNLPAALQHFTEKPLIAGAVLYLPFDKSDNNGSAIHDRGSAHLTLPATGVTVHTDPANNALGIADFDGGAWIDSKSLGDFQNGKGFTFATWFKATDETKKCSLIDNSDWSDGGHRGALMSIEDSVIYFAVGADDWIKVRNSAPTVPDKWCHVAGTFDGNFVRLYIDGREEGSSRIRGAFHAAKFPLEIGRNPYDTNRTFNGSLAQVLIFNRALPADEVAKLAGVKK